ncbi:hypothetical protein YC2023_101433 [Brassica napus]
MFGLSCGVEACRWCVVNPYRVQWLVLVGSGGSLLIGGAWKAQGEPFQSPMVSHSWSWMNKWRGGVVKARVIWQSRKLEVVELVGKQLFVVDYV